MPPINPLASVIIPSARAEQVLCTIEGLLAQNLEKECFEILVVTPEPDLTAEFDAVNLKSLHAEELYPPGKMRNLGARHARGEFLFFIDDDCLPPVEWMASMLKVLGHDERIGAAGCRVVSTESGFWGRCADYALFGAYQYDRQSQRDIGSAAMVVRRKAFDESGGFDEKLYASEDWDFNMRLEKMGWKRVFEPSAIVMHQHGRGSLGAILRQAYRSGNDSGMIVQEAHADTISLLARLSVRMRRPWLYWSLIFPYAIAVTVLQVIEQKHTDFFSPFFIPAIFFARLSYHIGVWRRLSDNQRPPAELVV